METFSSLADLHARPRSREAKRNKWLVKIPTHGRGQNKRRRNGVASSPSALSLSLYSDMQSKKNDCSLVDHQVISSSELEENNRCSHLKTLSMNVDLYGKSQRKEMMKFIAD